MYNQTQQTVIDYLFPLVVNAGNMLKVILQSQGDRTYKTEVIKKPDIVLLYLVEPVLPGDYQEWCEAIATAEMYVGMIEQERRYEENNPNFFKAVVARFNNIKTNI